MPRTLPTKTWTVRYNEKFTDTVSAEEYAVVANELLYDREQAHPFTIDSKDYFVLVESARAISNVPGLVIEIGFRGGGGMKLIIDALVESKKHRDCIALDPYGSIPFEGVDGCVDYDTEYTNDMEKHTLRNMYDYVAWRPNINFVFLPLEDTEFFARFKDGVPIYANNAKAVMNQYALVHFDGPHTTEATMTETLFFHERAPIGARFVYDDVQYFYDHGKIRDFLLKVGWKLVEETKIKASYVRME